MCFITIISFLKNISAGSDDQPKSVECWGTEGFDPTNYGMTGNLGKGTEGTPWVTEDPWDFCGAWRSTRARAEELQIRCTRIGNQGVTT